MAEIVTYRIIRSKRRTLALEINRGGEVLVRAPLRASNAAIKAFVASKTSWIANRLAQVVKIAPKVFAEGEVFWYLGQSYPLHFTPVVKPRLDLRGSFLLSRSGAAQAREIFIRWYKAEARAIIADRVELYREITGLPYRKFRITGARTRWGSCSPNNDLNFSWRLIMAPLEVVDYVVVHEFAHIKARNHSREFWSEVAKILPDYRRARKWLKEYGETLTL